MELAIGVAVFYFLLCELAHGVIVPRTIGRDAAPHPAIVIFAVLAGAALVGILGVVLAMPVAAALKVVQANWHRVVAAEEDASQLTYDAR